MRDAASVGRILSLFTSPDRAATIAGDLVEEGSRLDPVAFWARVVQTALAFVWRDIAASPIRFFALLVAAYVTSALIFWTFIIAPWQLAHRPYDDSLLSSFWVRQTADVLGSVWVFRLRQIFLNYFLVGIIVARLSCGREMAACCVLIAFNLAFAGVSAVILHGFASPTFSALAFETARQWPLLVAALLIRWWWLRRMRQYARVS